jgi:hypothetical protein
MSSLTKLAAAPSGPYSSDRGGPERLLPFDLMTSLGQLKGELCTEVRTDAMHDFMQSKI